MFKSHPAVSQMALAAALFCSASAAFAANVNPAPQTTPDESKFFTRFYYAYANRAWVNNDGPERAAWPAEPPPAAVAGTAEKHPAHIIRELAARRRRLYEQIDAQRRR